jgi:hypothetical protein
MKKWIIPVTYGRSGSTLLMGVLNSVPCVKILGENHNAYTHLWQFVSNMYRAKDGNDNMQRNYNVYGARNSWWNDFTKTTLHEQVRLMCENIIDPIDIFKYVGFKEIRYPSLKQELTPYLHFLNVVFNPFFIFLTRNLHDTCLSKWHAKNYAKCVKSLTLFEDALRLHMVNHLEERWIHLSYEELCDGNVKNLFDWLGLKKYYDKDIIKAVLDVKHGY